MPRATSSPESRILAYFKTAPLAAVTIVLGLAKEVVKDRQPKVGAKKRHRRSKAEMAEAKAREKAAAAIPAHEPRTAPKAKVSHKKKSHHKAKGKAAPQQTAAEVETVLDDLGERD